MTDDSALMTIVYAIADGDVATALRLLSERPELARERASEDELLEAIGHYIYGDDTALHIAAAAYQGDVARALLDAGADIRARNRRGAEPLHYAADGGPGARTWNPDAQAAVIACLIEAGADPNASDKSGVMPLHRAVRTRCAAAVHALLEGGADARAKNGSGSTPMDLATRTTGRGGSGSAEAKVQQEQIVRLLERATRD